MVKIATLVALSMAAFYGGFGVNAEERITSVACMGQGSKDIKVSVTLGKAQSTSCSPEIIRGNANVTTDCVIAVESIGAIAVGAGCTVLLKTNDGSIQAVTVGAQAKMCVDGNLAADAVANSGALYMLSGGVLTNTKTAMCSSSASCVAKFKPYPVLNTGCSCSTTAVPNGACDGFSPSGPPSGPPPGSNGVQKSLTVALMTPLVLFSLF
mmetsp:Transcript_12735/g.20589  ORF Transcript_12735/g.20589 Transcript_12735/m.20589 type:complete len:210 (-) Transcript_12735:901-1530(-)|eukprot:CAMPEP_0203760670 /NCGR_PEP_ID=MMETSP0098-20131031/13919_1 /ASSEMBLY_ACC=CAM_ASM_000208 /TAXON_ID=96639 /ORGANISM=" , Strain NY0313808BC1" /LENGTH=209 /DNA_ID=CAMNT_0050654341 /DNA_START=59 /DNA_END=688 /DNA_ORIENTATION=+